MPLLILLAEDDPGIQMAVKDYLEFSGYSVITAKNGDEALHHLKTYHPHLIVADIKMPRKDGFELIQEVRERPEFRMLPVIFLTQRGSTADRILGYEAGCDLYLPKPFEMAELGAVIKNLLIRSQMEQSEQSINAQQGSIHSEEENHEDFHFTQRESEVLELLTQGLSNTEMGEKLYLSPRTVEKYVSSLLRKTDTNNRAELVSFTLKHHLIS
ncbi:response regulator transcription factor [Dactylococcopsis salina]|uniref:Response regulator containing a CheY-like receiver domain and an HTH DNA-binding domain n=1 Tax=Dactylococcopsis salina (strain PCC 8305) TaxID=13035 RepID=K9YVV0_DACS8|nr:response regulator transcription factor [Dactylococcopsis salina]AFZ51029.1 response regulator containing a CheY-like receiver domain and an HTH DNA-binding domain [Dactylococcopsis salina PCC 8305]